MAYSLQENTKNFLINKKYDADFIHFILSKKEYYRSFETLIQLNLTQDYPQLMKNTDKLNQLAYINNINDEYCRQLCLIFWTKDNMSLADLTKIVKATEHYPMLAETLVNLDQTQAIINIHDLKKHAHNPLIHLPKSLVYFYKEQFKQYQLKKADLKAFSLDELNEINLSFNMLTKANIDFAEAYELVLKNNNQGKMLRLFLPDLAHVKNIEHRKTLIHLLYKGIQKGIVSQGKALRDITDPHLLITAQELHRQFICVKLLQDLRFNKESIHFAGLEGSRPAARFRDIILQVEKTCKEVHERLLKSGKDKEKIRKWQHADEEYRKTLYTIAYDGLTKPCNDLKLRISKAEEKILNIVDAETSTWLKKTLIIIANILITTLSLGIANVVKAKKTGNYWFFTETEASQKTRALNRYVSATIETPDKEDETSANFRSNK